MTKQAINYTPSQYASCMKTAMVDVGEGVELCVEVGGNPQNPAVLLIMGLGSQLIYWPESFCEKLIAQGFYVIRYDHRDIGLSSCFRNKNSKNVNFWRLVRRTALGIATHDEPIPYSLHDMMLDTLSLMNVLDLDKAHILGASMGGMIAQLLAAEHPQRVASLSLLFTSNLRALSLPPFPKQLNTLIARPKSMTENSIIEHGVKIYKTIGSPDYFDESLCFDLIRTAYKRSIRPYGYMHHFFAILSHGSLVCADKKIVAPTLVLHGSKDRLIHAVNGKDVAKKIKNAQFVKIEGMGHDIVPHFENNLVQHFTKHFKKHLDNK